MYVARRKYDGIRAREGWGGYLAEVVTHTLSGKGPFHYVFKTLVAYFGLHDIAAPSQVSAGTP